MSKKITNPEHYKCRLKQIEKRLRAFVKRSPVVQSGGISRKYLYLTKTYENAYNRLKALEKEAEVKSIEDIVLTLGIREKAGR